MKNESPGRDASDPDQRPAAGDVGCRSLGVLGGARRQGGNQRDKHTEEERGHAGGTG
jgi:hypothetical protein